MVRTSANRPTQPDEAHPLREEMGFVGGRLAFLFMLFLAGLGLFALRIYRLTGLEGQYYRGESENNFRTESPIPAPRGKIVDRNGVPLAINERTFDVSMSPFNMTADETTSSVRRLAALLGRPQIASKADAVFKHRPRWESVTLASDLKLDEMLPVAEQAFQLPGVVIVPSYERYYPAGIGAGNVTGNVGLINPKQLADFENRGYLRDEKVGKLNAEYAFEDLLHGVNGTQMVFRDSRGKPRSAPQIVEQAHPGDTVELTLDLKLQKLAYALLEGRQGAIIAMDPRDGSVLAMAQRPDYDPNYPAAGSQFNKISLGGSYPPGSTFKIVTASAGLLSGRSPDEQIYCSGAIMIGKYRFPCDLKWGHENQDLYQALQHSCNVFFYTWANRVGASAMIQTAEAYGFGKPTGFELAAGRESAGRVGLTGKSPILLGSVVQMGIGQGQLISVTPLQLANAYCALVNGGDLLRPRIVKEVRTSIEEPVDAAPYGQRQVVGHLPISATQRKEIMEGLRRVVQVAGGTGAQAGFKPEWNVAGKTGTAETGIKILPPHAWFVGIAPMDNPEIVILALVEQAGHGGAMAAPLVRQMMAAYFGQPEPQIVPPPPPGAKMIELPESQD